VSALNRRQFTKIVGTGAVATAAFGLFSYIKGEGKIVIIGGGAGGATVAHLLKKAAPNLNVTLVEMNRQYATCFFSNLYIGGIRSFDSLTYGYDGLKKIGVNVVHDMASGVDTAKKTVSLKNGSKLAYDKLVLSPGIDFKWETIEGYDEAASQKMPHAWKAGAQTKLLKQQLETMKDGGLVVMSAPPDPFRCPPGPYERASMIAHYVKTYKPKSKIIIFDPKSDFAKKDLFVHDWETHYEGIVEWLGTEMTDGGIKKVDPTAMTVTTYDGETIKADVVNIIPAQKAGKIAYLAGCGEEDWCPVNPNDFSSLNVKDVYVLGDSAEATHMPKSASSANSHAKILANAILAELVGKSPSQAIYYNVCWSLISPDNCVKYTATYLPGEKELEIKTGFLSAVDESKAVRAQTYREAVDWYEDVTSDMFGKD